MNGSSRQSSSINSRTTDRRNRIARRHSPSRSSNAPSRRSSISPTTSSPRDEPTSSPTPLVEESVLCLRCGQFHEKTGAHLFDYADFVDEDLNCQICLQTLVYPVDTICGHTFCYPCIKSHLRFQRFCPTDRNSLTFKELSASSILVHKLLDKLLVVCPNREFCDQRLQRCELEAHLANRCLGAPVGCARANLGCGFTGPRAFLQGHVAECLFYQNSNVISETIGNGVVSNIEISTPGSGYDLGMALIGGADTPLIYLIVQEVFAGGAVGSDGRLRPNDQILDVNGKDLTVMNHKRCVEFILRESEAKSKLRLAVYREATEECGKLTAREETLKVELEKAEGRSFGIKLTTRRRMGAGVGLYVDELIEGGLAAEDGRLKAEDRILEINGVDVGKIDQLKAVQLIQDSVVVEFIVARLPVDDDDDDDDEENDDEVDGKIRGSEEGGREADEEVGVETVLVNCGRSVALPPPKADDEIGASVSSFLGGGGGGGGGGSGEGNGGRERGEEGEGSSGRRETRTRTWRMRRDDRLKASRNPSVRSAAEFVVHIKKPIDESLGFSVAGGKASSSSSSSSFRNDAGEKEGRKRSHRKSSTPSRGHDVPIYVSKLTPGGVAEKNGGVKPGDVLTRVNGVSLLGVSHSESVDILKSAAASSSLTLHLISSSSSSFSSSVSSFEESRLRSFVPTWDYWLRLPSLVEPLKTITIKRSPNGSLGFSIVGGIDSGCLLSQSIFVKSVVPGSPAGVDGRLRSGDVVVAVDSFSLSSVRHSTAVRLLKGRPRARGTSNVSLTIVSWPGSIV